MNKASLVIFFLLLTGCALSPANKESPNKESNKFEPKLLEFHKKKISPNSYALSVSSFSNSGETYYIHKMGDSLKEENNCQSVKYDITDIKTRLIPNNMPRQAFFINNNPMIGSGSFAKNYNEMEQAYAIQDADMAQRFAMQHPYFRICTMQANIKLIGCKRAKK